MTEPEERQPTMYVLAGPNGAGKSTLYDTRLKVMHPKVEFINADRLAHTVLGRHAETLVDAQLGQRLADERRASLMKARADFITESTFSHESKLELVREAKASGYRVLLYHVNVRSPELSVARVEWRVNNGGHDVPENKIRERYERNQPLIRQAALESDNAYVFDNSRQNKAPGLVIGMEHGRVNLIGDNVPSWAMKLYSTELERFPKERLNPLAASFAQAQQHVIADLGDAAATYISRSGGTYRGKIIGETALHTLQQVSSKSVVAHITERLKDQPELGANVTVAYLSGQGRAQVSVISRGRSADPAAHDQARALRDLPRDEALRQQPNLKGAYGLLDAALSAIPKANENTRQRVSDAMRERMAQYIERGTPLPVPTKEKKTAVIDQPRKTERGARSPERERER